MTFHPTCVILPRNYIPKKRVYEMQTTQKSRNILADSEVLIRNILLLLFK